MSIYSQALKRAVIEMVDSGKTIRAVAREFSIPRATIHNWLNIRDVLTPDENQVLTIGEAIAKIRSGKPLNQVADDYCLAPENLIDELFQDDLKRWVNDRKEIIQLLRSGISNQDVIALYPQYSLTTIEGIRKVYLTPIGRPPKNRSPILKALKEGFSYSQIEQKFGCSQRFIRDLATQIGFRKKKGGITPMDYQPIIELLKENLPYSKIAKKVNVSIATVCHVAKKYKLNNRSRLSEGKRHRIDRSPIIAALSGGELSYQEIADNLKVSITLVRLTAKENNIPKPKCVSKPSTKKADPVVIPYSQFGAKKYPISWLDKLNPLMAKPGVREAIKSFLVDNFIGGGVVSAWNESKVNGPSRIRIKISNSKSELIAESDSEPITLNFDPEGKFLGYDRSASTKSNNLYANR